MPRRNPNTLTKKSPVIGSPQQEAIWKAMASTTHNLLIEARAGTGKTFTIVEGVKRLPRSNDRILFCAFNKAIQEELSARLPRTVECRTLHGLGLHILRQNFESVEYDNDKVMNLIKDLTTGDGPYAHVSFPRFFQFTTSRLVSYAKSVGLVVPETHEDLDISETEEAILDELCFHFSVEIPEARDEIFQLTLSVLRDSLVYLGTVNFDDMIYAPLALKLKCQRYDLVLVDEAQDLNASQLDLILACSDRLIVVGDRHQSIYGFRGADANSIPNIEKILGKSKRGLKVMPLTVCRRCPKSVIALAKQIVGDIEPMDDAPEGAVTHLPSEDLLENLRPGDMVQCRTNAPLVSLCLRLWKQNRLAYIQGRKFGDEIHDLVKSLKCFRLADLPTHLYDYGDLQKNRLIDRYGEDIAEMKYVQVKDKIDCILFLSADCRSMEDVYETIRRLFSDVNQSNAVRLTSIHRAKGLEANRVFIIHPEQIPHRMAVAPWEQQQETNLAYVAITRAISQLFFVDGVPSLLDSVPTDQPDDNYFFDTSGLDDFLNPDA
jgi:DNA helicase-2/ATP-dependent DNA helicase PcrA